MAFTHKLRKHAGFTLVETLTVIAVLGILGAALVIGGPKVMSIARVATAQNDIKNMTAAVSDASMRMGGTLPLTDFITAGTVGSSFEGYTIVGTNLQNSGGVGFGGNARLEQVLMGLSQPLVESYFRPSLGSQNFARTDGGNNNDLVWNVTAMTISNGDATTVRPMNYNNASRLECSPVDSTATPGVPSAAGVNFRLNGITNLPVGRVAYIVYMSVPGIEAYNLALKVNGNALMTDTSQAGTVAQTSGKVTYAAGVDGLNTLYVYLGNF